MKHASLRRILSTWVLFTLFLSLSTQSLFGQMFVNPSNEWLTDDCCYSLGQTNCYTYKYWFGETVVIDSVSYHRLRSNNPQPLFYVGEYYREDNGIVFMRNNINQEEYKIYNFNLNVGEQFEMKSSDNSFLIQVLSIDSITLNSGERRKRLHIASSMNTNTTTFWIEGIGSESSPLNPNFMFTLDCWNNLNCFRKDDSVEFQIGNCQLSSLKNIQQLERSITAYPNPAKDQVRFTSSDAQSMVGVSVIVTDTNGLTLWQSPDHADNTDHIGWQTEHVPPGVYLYAIRQADGLTQTSRVIIIK